MRMLYPPVEPYETFRLRVSPVHEIQVEQCGNPAGVPVVFFHGGPGGGIDPMHSRYFDASRYRIVLFDQRGAGKSTPHACLDENGTWELVDDAEKIREKLGIDKWHVFGGSWGSTLSLAYAVKHPERTRSLTLRGILFCKSSEEATEQTHDTCEPAEKAHMEWVEITKTCNEVVMARYEEAK